METSNIVRDLASLPPEEQQQVMDLIALLKTRYRATPRRQKTRKLADEPFIGMWRDRDDMQDSTAWVRQLRHREWEHTK